MLLDAKSTPKPATVNVHRLATFRDRLQAGLMFKLSGFDISRRNQKFRLSYLFMTIRLSDSTNLDVLTGPDSPIPEGFRFRDHNLLLGQQQHLQIIN